MSPGTARLTMRWALSAAAVLSLAACTKDTEEDVRAEVSNWLSLGDTRYFKSTRACTAGIFETRSGRWTSAVVDARSWEEARLAFERDRVVVFESISLSPSDFTGIIVDEDPSLGSQIISAGLAARDCLDDTGQKSYLAALRDVNATLIYDPMTQTVGVLEADRSRFIASRGELR